MRPETLARLCNPYTGEPLNLQGSELLGLTSGRRFPIQDNIPSFISNAALPPRNRFWRWFYDLSSFAYDFTVDLGDRLNYGGEGITRRAYVASFDINPGDWVLESAIGTASNIKFLPDHAHFYGVDISRNMLRRAQRNLASLGRTAELFHADSQFLPFHDKTFDLVFSMGGLQFFSDPFQAVSEMARVAKAGAHVIVLDETRRAAVTLKRLPAHARYAADGRTSVEAMLRLAPFFAQDARIVELPAGHFYALRFTKPPRT